MNYKKVFKKIGIALLIVILSIIVVIALFAFIVTKLYEHEMNSRVWHEEGYEIRENEVVYWVCVMGCHPWTVLGADLETFYIINERYAADKNHIYAANDLIVIDPNGCFYRKDGRWFMNDEDCEKMYVEPSASVISREREKIIEEEYRKLRETQNLKKKELSEQ